MPRKKSSNNLPKNWPPHLPYLQSPSYSPTLSAEQRVSLSTKPQDALAIPPNTPQGPCALVKITHITDPAHPARGQAGLFAAKDLKPGSFVIEYLGVVHSSPAALPSAPVPNAQSTSPPPTDPTPCDPHAASDYDLSLSRAPHSLAADAALTGNEARFINDYRGIRGRPNAEFRDVWNEGRQEYGIGVWVLRVGKSGKGMGGVRKGEEIVVSYGRGFWGARSGGRESKDGPDCGRGRES